MNFLGQNIHCAPLPSQFVGSCAELQPARFFSSVWQFLVFSLRFLGICHEPRTSLYPLTQRLWPPSFPAWLRLVTPLRRVTSPRFLASKIISPWDTMRPLQIPGAIRTWKVSASLGLIFTNSLGMPGSIRT